MGKMREFGSLVLIGALFLYAIHTLGNKKSDDNDGVDTKISIEADTVNFHSGVVNIEVDDLENN